MVRIVFRLTDIGPVDLPLAGSRPFSQVLALAIAQSGYTPGGYIAVRGGRVVGADDLVDDGQIIEVFPALSGG